MCIWCRGKVFYVGWCRGKVSNLCWCRGKVSYVGWCRGKVSNLCWCRDKVSYVYLENLRCIWCWGKVSNMLLFYCIAENKDSKLHFGCRGCRPYLTCIWCKGNLVVDILWRMVWSTVDIRLDHNTRGCFVRWSRAANMATVKQTPKMQIIEFTPQHFSAQKHSKNTYVK